MAIDNASSSNSATAEVVPAGPEANPTVQALRAAFPDLELRIAAMRGQDWAVVPASGIVEICAFLRDDPRTQYKMLTDITAVDLLPRAPRWDVVYSLLSLSRNDRFRLKVEVPDGEAPSVPTMTPVWPAANWYEREIFDLMGIRFTDHPDMRRILLPDDWIGHPLRFDHPLGGEEVGFTS